MAVDPRFNFTIKSACDRSQTAQQKDSAEKKGFFDNLGSNALGAVKSLSDVELFQGPVADGLRDLVKISDSIRGGTNAAIITNGVSGKNQEGANVVLEKVGISPNEAVKAGRFNPGVVNRGTAEAKGIYDRVKQGNFKLKDAPNSFQNLQNLKSLVGGVYTPGAGESSRIELCGAVPYARALIRFAPKYKFLYIVQFTFKPEYADLSEYANNMAFVVKTCGRPNVNIEHEEVNMYNFHTKIAKRVSYEPITMRFIDDQKGMAHYFLSTYIRAISPITRSPSTIIDTDIVDYRQFEDNGLGRVSSDGKVSDAFASSSMTKLNGNVTSIFNEIRIFHMYDNAKRMVAYSYANPKITSINFDELDMAENGNGNEIEMQFAYDRLAIIDGISVEENQELVETISGGGIGETTLNIVPVFPPSSADSAAGGADDKDTPEFLKKASEQDRKFLESVPEQDGISSTENLFKPTLTPTKINTGIGFP